MEPRGFQIVGNARRHLAYECETFALSQFPFELQLLNQAAEIERRRQLFTKKFQRCVGFSRNHGAVRASLQRAEVLFAAMNRKGLFCATKADCRPVGRGAIDIERDEPQRVAVVRRARVR